MIIKRTYLSSSSILCLLYVPHSRAFITALQWLHSNFHREFWSGIKIFYDDVEHGREWCCCWLGPWKIQIWIVTVRFVTNQVLFQSAGGRPTWLQTSFRLGSGTEVVPQNWMRHSVNAARSRFDLDDGKCHRGAEASLGSIMKSRGLQLLAGCISYYYRWWKWWHGHSCTAGPLRLMFYWILSPIKVSAEEGQWRGYAGWAQLSRR